MRKRDLEQAYRRYGPMVLRRARQLLGDEALAQDALQEVFIRVLGSWDRFRHESAPSTWLYRIATNYCINLLRDRHRRRQLLKEQDIALAPCAPAGSDKVLLLRQTIETTPPELWEIAAYYYVDGMSHEEIAELVGVSRRTIGNRLKQFRNRADGAWPTPCEAIG